MLAAEFDPCTCNMCGEPYVTGSPDSLPVILSCGHTCCNICGSAVTVAAAPVCPTCKQGVDSEVIHNAAFVTYVESLRAGRMESEGVDAIRSTCSICPSGATMGCTVCSGTIYCVQHGGEHRTVTQHVLQGWNVPESSCVTHSGEALTLMCCKRWIRVCSMCVEDHVSHCVGCELQSVSNSAVLDVGSAELCERAQLYRRAADLCVRTAGSVMNMKQELESNTTLACGRYVDAVAAIKSVLDASVQRAVDATQRACKERCKALDAQLDELLITESQLKLAAGWCERGVATGNSREVWGVVDALPCFDQLIRRPVTPFPVASSLVDIVFDVSPVQDALQYATSRVVLSKADVVVQETPADTITKLREEIAALKAREEELLIDKEASAIATIDGARLLCQSLRQVITLPPTRTVRLLFSVWCRYAAEPAVVCDALTTLSLWCASVGHTEAARDWLPESLASQILTAIVTAMTDHASNIAVQLSCCVALNNVCGASVEWLAMAQVRNDVVTACRQLLSTTSANPGIVKASSSVLRLLRADTTS